VTIGDGEPDRVVLDRFRAAMDDDLDTPGASALLFDTLRKANALIDAGDDTSATQAAATVREMCVALGLDLRATADVPDDVAAKATALDEARAAKDFATADALRAELQADGWTVETTKNGTTIRR
jgi:cysteinyl-tRNA synthetase